MPASHYHSAGDFFTGRFAAAASGDLLGAEFAAPVHLANDAAGLSVGGVRCAAAACLGPARETPDALNCSELAADPRAIRFAVVDRVCPTTHVRHQANAIRADARIAAACRGALGLTRVGLETRTAANC